MEKVEGITPDTPQALRDAGLDTHQIAVNGANALLTMILRHGFFHADPHPGNIFILPGNVVAFIDFGMVGALTPRDMNFLADFAIGFARRDSDLMSRALLVLCGKKFFEHEEEMKFEIHQLMMQYAGIPLELMNFAGTMQKCVDVIVKYQLQIPSGIFMLIKALATLEKFAGTLAPDLSLTPVILPYAKEVVKVKYSPRKVAAQLYDTLTGYMNFIRNFPNDMSEILYKLKEGKIKHDIHLADDDLFVRTVRQASRRVAYTLIVLGHVRRIDPDDRIRTALRHEPLRALPAGGRLTADPVPVAQMVVRSGEKIARQSPSNRYSVQVSPLHWIRFSKVRSRTIPRDSCNRIEERLRESVIPRIRATLYTSAQ